MKQGNRAVENIGLMALSLVYVSLTLLCWHNGFFFDAIQQVSAEAHWYYENGWGQLLIPPYTPGTRIFATGYHPPLNAMTTALLWKAFGYEVYVIHIWMLVLALILGLMSSKIISYNFKETSKIWPLVLLLIEPTVLSQFAIMSPDFVMLVAFSMAAFGLMANRMGWAMLGLLFLCGTNMRGIFAGALLMAAYWLNILLWSGFTRQQKVNVIRRTILIVLPTVLLLTTYFTYYFLQRGWFFSNSEYGEHYTAPAGMASRLKNVTAILLRSLENGRFVVFVLAAILLPKSIRQGRLRKWPTGIRLMLLFFVLHYLVYFTLAVITQMPYSGRYFMISFYALAIVVFYLLAQELPWRWQRPAWLVCMVAMLSGHFWVYPSPMSVSWDSTLAHLPYYQLKSEVFDYIDKQGIPNDSVAGGFCFYGYNQFKDLNRDKRFIAKDDTSKPYFIYSNVSNPGRALTSDFQDTTRWVPELKLHKGFVAVVLYRKK